jgi:NAD(P)H-dependent nitrite reductase small subunit
VIGLAADARIRQLDRQEVLGELANEWSRACELEDILPSTGVCALVAEKQVAIFRIGERVFAIDNFDPVSRVHVLSRGIVGDVRGQYVVASPLYKDHFSLTTGRCLENPAVSVNVYPVRVIEGGVWLNPAVVGIELFPTEHADSAPGGHDCEDMIFRDPRREVYKRLVLRDNRLHAAVLYGDVRHGHWYLDLMAKGADVAPLRDQLLFGPPAAPPSVLDRECA